MTAQPYIVGEDRETGRLCVLGRGQMHNFGTKRKPRYVASKLIPREILASPFWRNIRVLDEPPKESSNG